MLFVTKNLFVLYFDSLQSPPLSLSVVWCSIPLRERFIFGTAFLSTDLEKEHTLLLSFNVHFRFLLFSFFCGLSECELLIAVTACVALANILKSSLGPVGLDKMIVDEIGDVTISNDGATILSKLEVEHPAAKILVELAQRQDKEVGDGTTSVVLLAAELLKVGCSFARSLPLPLKTKERRESARSDD
jgi:hypothetical protein